MSTVITLATSIGKVNAQIEQIMLQESEFAGSVIEEAGCLEDINIESNVVVLNEYVFRASASHKETDENRYAALSQFVQESGARIILLAYYRNRTKFFFRELITKNHYDVIFVDRLSDGQDVVEMIIQLIKEPRTSESYRSYIESIASDDEIEAIQYDEQVDESIDKDRLEEALHQAFSFEQEHVANNVAAHTAWPTQILEELEPIDKKIRAVPQVKHKEEGVEEMTISCWYSVRPGMGAGTIALAAAVATASEGKRVLLIDADYTHPVIHTMSGITHSKRNILNFFRSYEKDQSVDPRFFITTKESILEEISSKQKKLMKNIQQLPESLHFLTFPKDYDFQTASGEWFPSDHRLILNMLEKVAEGGYEHIMLLVPSLLDDPITLPALTHANQVINVLSPSLPAIEEYKTMKSYISTQMNGVISLDSWRLILNKVNVSYQEKLELILEENAIQTIPMIDLLDEALEMKAYPEKLQAYVKSIITKMNWIEEKIDNPEVKTKRFGIKVSSFM
ncbi:hypothetical protein ABHN11_24490 [Brevibacillus centrosporus]|uniref:hypothetical protein n=1 Tax=Brevibacillus centrosporus TaxID=54910 RepID=UPI003D261872